MNQRACFQTRHTVTISSVGSVSYATTTLAPAYLKGRVRSIEVSKLSGTGVQVQTQITENGVRLMHDSGGLANFPLTRAELSRDYTLSAGQTLTIGAKVNAGSDTNISIDIVVEA